MTTGEDWDDTPPADSTGDNGEAPPLRFPTLDAWVEQWFVDAMWLHLDDRGRIWCPKWWHHIGAIVRLEALWRSWEAARLDPAHGMVGWLHEADYHLTQLLDPNGPLKGCSTDRGHDDSRNRRLPVESPPRGLFAEGD